MEELRGETARPGFILLWSWQTEEAEKATSGSAVGSRRPKGLEKGKEGKEEDGEDNCYKVEGEEVGDRVAN